MKTKILLIFVALSVALLGMMGCQKDPDNNINDNNTETPGDNPTDPHGPSAGGFDANGASNAVFSVASGRTVRFSRGNLQYQASTGIWRFAEHQYNMIGSANSDISSSYSGWIDFFGWGTSGWNSGSNAYQPWSVSTECGDYYV